ncbi:hypothetical protein [Paraburkholderia tropica]|uniref:hypothetical protein n=1 Tax=Paraburkholderia tropica TaxID=92647 RepID=UPI003D265FDE
MTEQTQLAVAEQPQQLITIEPAKYVALVFESFRKKFDAYKAEADNVTFDITTAAGMKTAVEWRAKFRDEIRIACENARKERKAPILEIGRLLDGKAKEIAEEVAPYESRFDSAIKAEEARKEAEKQAKAEAERVRVNAIRVRIDEMRTIPSAMVGKTAEHIARCIEGVEKSPVTLEEFQEFAGECEMAKVATLDKLREMLAAQQAHETEAARLAAEREQLARERAEAAERERIAAAARAEEERKAREAREAEDALVDSIWKNARRIEANSAPYIRKAIGIFESAAKDWESDPRQRVASAISSAREEMQMKLRSAEEAAEREAYEAELRKQREAEEAKLAEARAEIARQQAELAAAKAEQERIERERLEAIEAEERRKQEELEANRRAEAQRAAEALEAIENENRRRAAEQFLANGPGDGEIVEVLANHYDVGHTFVVDWLAKFDAASFLAPTEKAA